MRKALIVLLCCGSSFSIKAQIAALPNVKIDKKTNDSKLIQKYYKQAIRYKNGVNEPIDYAKAFYYFSKAADLGDAQSVYALGYMHYKGLGTVQDYPLAARLFKKGAFAGRDNSMYFYALCWRNGYGLLQNEDSARYWLNKAAAMGYKQAVEELKIKSAENSNVQAKQLVQKIHNAALPEYTPPNQFISIQAKMPDSVIIAGDYAGYIIQYDWSGKHAISSRRLTVNLQADNSGGFAGKWMEETTDTISIKTSLKEDSLVFDNTFYKRKDHYSPKNGIIYDFKNATLNLVQKHDSIYLAGNIYMFSPDRKEPSKPLFVALTRVISSNNTDSNYFNKQKKGLINELSRNVSVKLLNAYPNPFDNYIDIAFKVNEATSVAIKLYDMVGQKVFEKEAEALQQGKYKIRIEPSSRLAKQTYLLKLVFTGGAEVVKMLKK